MINRLKGQWIRHSSAEYHEWCPDCGKLDGVSFDVGWASGDYENPEFHFHCNKCGRNYDPESYLEAWEKAMSQP